MSERLVRAKTKIREAGIAFAVPELAELPRRLGAVLVSIYAAHGTAWDEVTGADAGRQDWPTRPSGSARPNCSSAPPRDVAGRAATHDAGGPPRPGPAAC
jgi:hypothetical protein